jgi:two-component system, sensor histidine kinase and response regulator
MKHTILCVDDEIDNVEALERLFRSKYTVLKSSSGAQAIEILHHQLSLGLEVAVIITDQRMPGFSGVELLQKVIEISPHTMRILLTGYTDVESIIEAVNNGQIYRYINKPWDPVDLVSTVNRAAERYQLQKDLFSKNAELQSALTDLQSLDKAKSQFMILINHELKTPLTSILSFVQILKETELDDEQEKYASRILKSAEKLKSIIDDVLIIVAAEAQTLKPRIQPFEDNSISFYLPTDTQNQAAEKKIKITTQWLGKKIVGDRSMVEQVFNRLIQNAIKFANESSVIEIRAVLTNPHRAKFSIYNQGPSISPAMINKIMHPFLLDEDVMNHSVGMGLGLTICNSYLKSLASNLEIINRPAGVEAFFELPCL